MRGLIMMAVLAAALLTGGLAGAQDAAPQAFQPARIEASNFLFGLDSAGPYPLSWSRVAYASERVELNGVPLLRGIDYNVDWEGGTITFLRPLPAGSAAYVTYLRQPGQSQPSRQPVDVPITINLGGPSQAALSLAMRYHQNGSGPGRLIYGLRASGSGPTRLEAALLFSQQVPSISGSGRGGYGWRLGARRSFANLDLAASLTGTSAGFCAPEEIPAPAGQQTLNLAAAYRPLANLTANASLTSVTGAADPSHPTSQTVELGLAAKLPGADLSLAHRSVESSGEASSSRSATDQMRAKVSMGVTSLSAAYQASMVNGSRSSELSLRLSSALAQGLNLTASHSQGDAGSAFHRASDVSLDLSRWKQARLLATVGSRQGEKLVDYQGVEATVHPVPQLTLQAAYKQSSFGETTLASRRAAVELAPVGQFKIGGEYAQNPEDATGVQQVTQAQVHLTTQVGFLGLTGSLARKVAVSGDERQEGEVKLSLALTPGHQVYTGYRQTAVIPASGVLESSSESYLVGYHCSIGGDFSLALEGRMERSRDLQQIRRASQQRANAKLNWRF